MTDILKEEIREVKIVEAQTRGVSITVKIYPSGMKFYKISTIHEQVKLTQFSFDSLKELIQEAEKVE